MKPRRASPLQVLALHGFSGHGGDYHFLQAEGPADWQWLCPDLPGHGQNRPLTDLPALEQCATFVRTEAQQCDPRTGTVAIGYSLGGRLLLHTLLSTETISPAAVVLIGAHPGLESAEARQQRCRQDLEWAQLLSHAGCREFIRAWKAQPLLQSQNAIDPPLQLTWLLEEDEAPLVADVARLLVELSPGRLQPLWNKLDRLHCPVLLVSGIHDRKYTELNRRIAARLENARVAVIPESGHAPHLENPSAFLPVVVQFLEETGVWSPTEHP